MRTVLVVGLCLVFGGAPAFADAPAGGSLVGSVEQLEIKFFEHTYPQQTLDDRLSRLEKLIFGETRSGSEADRVATLKSALTAHSTEDEVFSAVASGKNSASTNRSPVNSTSSPVASAPDPSYADQPDNDDAVPDSSDYPHVTALEKELLGATYAGLPVTQRLDQLETKVFGGKSSSADLSARVDRLEQFAEVHLHRKAYGVNPRMVVDQPDYDDIPVLPGHGAPAVASQPDPDPMSPAPRGGSVLEKVTWMEARVLGRTYKNDHLMDRLRRVDMALFPTEAPPPGMKLMDQVDTLMGAAEHFQPHSQIASTQANPAQQQFAHDAGAAPTGQDTSASGRSRHPRLRSLAHALGTVGEMALGTGTGGAMGPGGVAVPGFWF